jgi:hypothetical protein
MIEQHILTNHLYKHNSYIKDLFKNKTILNSNKLFQNNSHYKKFFHIVFKINNNIIIFLTIKKIIFNFYYKEKIN